MTLLAHEDSNFLSSNYIAGSLNINPVLVRKELAELKRLNLIESKEGKNGGVRLSKTANHIKLSDLFNMVKGDSNILGFSKNTPNPHCPIGKNINNNLGKLYTQLDANVASILDQITLEEFKNQF